MFRNTIPGLSMGIRWRSSLVGIRTRDCIGTVPESIGDWALVIGFFAGFGWGWRNWGYDWRGGRAIYGHGGYISHSHSIVDRSSFRANREDFGRSGNFRSSEGMRSGAFSGFQSWRFREIQWLPGPIQLWRFPRRRIWRRFSWRRGPKVVRATSRNHGTGNDEYDERVFSKDARRRAIGHGRIGGACDGCDG